MSGRLCIATVSTANWFQGFIPLMVYSAIRANPGDMVKIWLLGEMEEYVKRALGHCPKGSYKIFENAFDGVPCRQWTPHSLRHLLPEKEFEGFDYVFICDLDFIFVKTRMPIVDYYGQMMYSMQLPYAGARGPKRWNGMDTRIAEGTLCLNAPEWFKVTKNARKYYMDLIKADAPDRFDAKKPGSYREWGEVMLYRICTISALETPTRENCYPNGNRADPSFRQIHVGDFKFKKRPRRLEKMRKILPLNNIYDYVRLREDNDWKRIVNRVRKNNEKIAGLLHKLDRHVVKRLALG